MSKSYTYNKVQLVGFLKSEPTYQEFGENTHHAILQLYTYSRERDPETSQNRQVRDNHRVVVKNGGLVNSVVRELLGEGSHVLVEGKLKTRSWKDKRTGEWKYITEVIVSGQDCKIQLISDTLDR